MNGKFNGDHMKQQGKRWPWENQQPKGKDRVLVIQDSILEGQDSIPRAKKKNQTKAEKGILGKYSLKD